MHRREFLGSIALPAAAAVPLACVPVLRHDAHERVRGLALDPRDPEDVARDESFWFQVQQAFTPDRAMVNLNNGGVCPAPRVVQDAMKRYLDHANTAPAYVLWRVQDPEKETVRAGLARLFGADPEEIAITRNASESLENVQQGFDLERGDEIVTTTQDYPRMLTTWEQRERREGIVLRKIVLPVPCEDPAEVVRRFAAAITDRTRLLHMSHVINLTGQVLPVRDVVRMARAKGIPVIVDGAHSFAHLDFAHADLDCDFYGTSLHKFLFAPHGTGMLFVRREKIETLWPLMAAPKALDADIRKFEEIGTHPMANFLAIADALTFHFGIGPANKLARMLYLRDHWAKRLVQHPRVKLNTSLKPGFATGVCNVQIEGVDSIKLADHLWNKHKLFTVAIVHDEFQGVRVSPAVYTTLGELDRFCDAMERVLRDGFPA
ncbi:MAG: aminotransferase class V-fold PLP-dependent enzyme [Planctomycetes bacterium]|nr:aminotransferase class V-fold PLP-dependent enzyme [Planctomycetota bacterium]